MVADFFFFIQNLFSVLLCYSVYNDHNVISMYSVFIQTPLDG